MRRCTDGDETDAHGPGRKHLTAFARPGVATKTKRRTNRRERREGELEALEQYYEEGRTEHG